MMGWICEKETGNWVPALDSTVFPILVKIVFSPVACGRVGYVCMHVE